ncbi:MAG TPA: hypothetical protein VH560_07715 [Polyangia bacterium]|nr:hypothetical protein [Polyangia bacterium]
MHSGGIDPLIRAAGDAGATGIHLGGGVVLSELEAIVPAVLRAGLLIPSMTLPCAPRVLAAHKRLPSLAAADGDERGAAIALASEGLEAGVAAAVRWAFLDFGAVALPVTRREIAASFARRALGPGEDGASDLAIAFGARRAQGERLSDACHWSLERLGRLAEARSVTLILSVGGSPWEVPSAREALALVAAFQGAPLALLWAPGKLTAARALGLRLPEDRVAAVAKAAGAALETDAVGMDARYLPGLGERDEALPAAVKLGADAPVVVSGSPGATDAEIARAVATVAARYELA